MCGTLDERIERIDLRRVVLIYSSLKLRGELKVIGLAAAGLRFRIIAHRVDQSSGTGAEVDARGQFVFEHISPGEYELRALPDNTPNIERLDERIMRMIYAFKERVVVAGDNPHPVVLVIDLNKKDQ